MNKQKKVEVRKKLDSLERYLFGMSKKEAYNLGICVKCKNPATNFKDNLSEREYMITGFCQGCQDEFYKTLEDSRDWL